MTALLDRDFRAEKRGKRTNCSKCVTKNMDYLQLAVLFLRIKTFNKLPHLEVETSLIKKQINAAWFL